MWFRHQLQPSPNVVSDTHGFAICEDGAVRRRVDWGAVREIVAFKRDLLSYDEICLEFRTDEADGYVEVWESYEGYGDLYSVLPHHFPDIRTDWFAQVAFPAFAKNWTVLWGDPISTQKI